MNDYPDSCPKCDSSLIGDDIPEKDHKFFLPPYKFGRVIGLSNREKICAWQCPDCDYTWARDVNFQEVEHDAS